jgi:rubrerythrin
MEDPTKLGHNRTGMQISPREAARQMRSMEEFDVEAAPDMQPETTLAAEMRREYINEADAIGSMPPPATVKGALKAGAGALTGTRTQVFIDKLGERLAYERGGTRLYDAALVKAVAAADGTPVTVERMKQIRNQEAEHAELLREAIESVGADPTVQTPSADLVGVQAMGLMQSVTDPRTTLEQTLSSLLAAELIDVASWELLARLARDADQEELAAQFEQALEHENEHLQTISGWYQAMVTAETRLLS